MNELDKEIIKRFIQRKGEKKDIDKTVNMIVEELAEEVIQVLRQSNKKWLHFMLDNDEQMWGDTDIRIQKWIMHFTNAHEYLQTMTKKKEKEIIKNIIRGEKNEQI